MKFSAGGKRRRKRTSARAEFSIKSSGAGGNETRLEWEKEQSQDASADAGVSDTNFFRRNSYQLRGLTDDNSPLSSSEGQRVRPFIHKSVRPFQTFWSANLHEQPR